MAKKMKAKLPVAKVTEEIRDAPYKRTKDDEARERRWKAEDALRTCKEYEKIKGDKQLRSDVKQLAKEEMNKLEKVAGK